MKKIMGKVRDLSQKAAEIQAAMERVPPKIAQVRESVVMTGGQLRQLRADVQASVIDLRADSENGLLQALKELNGAGEVFEQAGYEMAALDMELNPNQRLILHLWKMAECERSAIEALARANQHVRTVHGVLTSILRAEEFAPQVNLPGFIYQKLIVHVGPIPSVRMCWSSEDAEETESLATIPAAAPVPTSVPVFSMRPTSTSAFEQSSYFEKRSGQERSTVVSGSTSPPVESVVPEVASEATSIGGSQSATPPATPASDWKKDALDRFKKMPDMSKYRR